MMMNSRCIRNLSLSFQRQSVLPYTSFLSVLPHRHNSTSVHSPYYVQHFANSADHYLLLLPRPSPALGRLHLSNPRKSTADAIASLDGPSAAFISPISIEELASESATFVQNAGFLSLLHATIAQHIAREQCILSEAAVLPTRDGWVHLCDERALPPYKPSTPRPLTVDSDGSPSQRTSLAPCTSRTGRSRRKPISPVGAIDS